MVQKFKEGMISDKVAERILWLSILFFITFFGITILSYYLLPEGLLLGKNRISDFKTSENFFLCTAQIFLCNMLSVAFIFVGSMFAKRSILALPPAGIVRSGSVLRYLSCEAVAAEAPWHSNHADRARK